MKQTFCWIFSFFAIIEMLSCCLSRYYCIVNNCGIVAFINSSLYSCEMYKQVKEMVILHLLNTITNTLYQSSEKGMSLLFTCPQLTEELSSVLAACCKKVAAVYCTCYAIYFCLVESIPQLLELWPISMHFHGLSSFTLLYRNATMLPCLKLKYFNLPNQCIVLH